MLQEPLEDVPTMVATCERRLAQAILSGTVQPGARLPPERTLAEQWGVNRVTVRGALQRLAAAGLLDVRQGRGYTVQDFRRAGGPDLLPHLLTLTQDDPEQHASLLADLLRIRRHLAAAALEAVAEQQPSAAPLARAVAAFADADPTRLDAIAAADLDVLAALLSMTGSTALQVCINPLAGVLAASPRLRAVMYARPAENLAGWQALLAWAQAPSPATIPAILGLIAARDQQTLAALRGYAP